MPRSHRNSPLTTARILLISAGLLLSAYAKYVDARTGHASSTNANLIGH